MSFHVPKTFDEVMHSPITLITGTAAITTAVICAYYNMRNAQGNILLDEAAENLITMAQAII